jgi:thiosulfate/3-mercaptopyruvate sulfurtransferase
VTAGVQGGRAEVVVSTEWLAAHLYDADVVVVDIRGKVLPPGSKPRYVPKRDDFDASHIPGAVFVDWTRDIVDLDDPVPSQVAKPEAFAAKMGELGIGDDTLVVAYDDYDHIFAGRLAWALRYYGHDKVRILDGGFSRWVAEGRTTTSGVASHKLGVFHPRPRPELRLEADQVARMLGKSDVLLIDARPAEQYAGVVSAAARGGHIPGARNVPYAKLVDPQTGKFLGEGQLAKAFADAGIDVKALPKDVVVYCNGGISCTVPQNALRMLGRHDVAVYDGSWNEWGNDEQRPAKTGGEP